MDLDVACSWPPDSFCTRARRIWLSEEPDLKEVECLYRRALEPAKESTDTEEEEEEEETRSKKRRLDETEQREAREKLALLLCQSGRSDEAKEMLQKLGHVCRLATCVLDYPTKANTPSKVPQGEAPCCVYDSFLTDPEIARLSNVFGDPSASYWTDHNYRIEPPSPYFSYLIPLDEARAGSFGFVGKLVLKCLEQLRHKFPSLERATCVEMWAHNRPHASGHQMHFDSDNEGIGGIIRNPIISTILYVTGDAGGPSLVTNQKLVHTKLASHGWLSHAKAKRLVAFDGKVLHGVVPGKGGGTGAGRSKRRVTLMFAFWRKIQVRNGGESLAARKFPSEGNSWTEKLRSTVDLSDNANTAPTCVPPIPLSRVYETLDGEPWTKRMGFPGYDQVFQGF